MKTFKILLAVMLVLFLIVQPAYSAPKEDNNGKAKGHDKFEEPKVHKEHPKHEAKGKGLKRGYLLNQGQQKANVVEFFPEPKKLPLKNKHAVQSEMQLTLTNLQEVLNKVQNSKWWYNAHPESESGNMGKPEMLDPYGHDKDSDRMELYGNRGRVIKTPVVEPAPEPEQEPPVIEPEPEPIPEPPVIEPEPEPEPPLPEPEPEPELPPFGVLSATSVN